ncbi:MAG TPA: amidohydrolase [Candidatus Eisenbergiella merdipullorum]|uniref:Amidohydrolase n=1 Tax=Candidatus Eisenbergiella merdipullorum TaxID=2838553 RepID=A0A9D2IAM8_9FIRM|nr:amidohydrolase [Candidatus Eisenbergiella merdipullorum]
MQEKLKEIFEWFHRNPELSYAEYRTTERIRQLLTDAGIEILPYTLETGLAAVIRGEKKGPVQALRCDIDALPVTEETGLPYASETPGRMHACGHDFHITAGLGTAFLLRERKRELAGTVKILFQPGEESSLGALKMLETDVMKDVERIWGLHADPTNAAGVIGLREGAVAAAVDRFVITIKGVGCHGAHPDDGVDPIPAACAVVQALQTIVTRNVNAFHPSLISVTRIEAGKTWNVIPPEAWLEGTVRTMDRADRELFQKKTALIAEKTAEAYGAQAEAKWIPGPPAVINDAKMAEFAADTARRLGFTVVPEEQSLGGDDFSFYEEKIPGCYIKIGTGKGQLIHQPGFAVEESVLEPAAKYLAAVLMGAYIS